MISGLVSAQADDVKVIANPRVSANTVSAQELKGVFLEERNSLGDGTHVEPVLQKRGMAHQAFLRDFLGKNDDALQTYYRTLVFTGRGSMPKALGSDAEVVAYVAQTKGAIGYVSAGATAEGVKTLAVSPIGNAAERRLTTRIEPEYPDTLRRLHIGGTVRLRVTVSSKGNVEKVELLGGNPILAETAIAAVKQWEYSAGRSRTVTEVSIPFDPGR
jgi:TonB family protein